MWRRNKVVAWNGVISTFIFIYFIFFFKEQGLAAARQMKEENPNAETRVVFITDMCDNNEDEGGAAKLFDLTKEMEKEEGIHVSYVGVGVDFDGGLYGFIVQHVEF